MRIEVKCQGANAFNIDQLEAYQGELKSLSLENYQKLKKEILELGFCEPISIWESDGKFLIANGHQRLRTLSKMRSEGIEVPAIPVNFIYPKGEEEFSRIVLALTSQYGVIEKEGLYEYMTKHGISMKEVEASFRFPEINFPRFEVEYFEDQKYADKDEDEIPVVKSTSIKPGDLFEVGKHRLLCGDCTDRTQIDLLMNGEIADFCFTSPPYSDQRDYRGELELSPSHLAMFLNAPCDLFAVNLGLQKKDHEIVPYWNEYLNYAKSVGLKLLSWNVWDKQQCGSIGQQTMMFPLEHEWIFILGKKPRDLNKTEETKWGGIKKTGASRNKDGSIQDVRNFDVGMMKPIGTVLRQFPEKARNHDFDHPAMFPVAFPERYILACTNVGQSVFEPFCGSGTTLIAAEKTNRRCFGLEIDPLYCQVILDRWAKFTGQEPKLISSSEAN